MKRRGMLEGPAGNLNLTPLLDVIFNLVFFFVLATTIRDYSEERQIEIRLPEARSGDSSPDTRAIPEIVLMADGSVFFEGNPVTDEELEGHLRAITEGGDAREVFLASDGEVAWQRVVAIHDICRRAGITQVLSRIVDPGGRMP